MFRVIQNAWNGQGRLMQITVYKSAFFWVYLLNAKL